MGCERRGCALYSGVLVWRGGGGIKKRIYDLFLHRVRVQRGITATERAL
jgi:hypothetical protein